MEDEKILDLYWERSQDAIRETAKKYGAYCHKVAFNILRSQEDSEECVNDTYLNAWNAIPPHRPNPLLAFLCRITRNLSFDRYKSHRAEKRGGGQVALALAELEECIPSAFRVEQALEDKQLAHFLDEFLGTLTAEYRRIFLLRYWYLMSVKEISVCCTVSESKVKSALFHTRRRLKAALEQEAAL